MSREKYTPAPKPTPKRKPGRPRKVEADPEPQVKTGECSSENGCGKQETETPNHTSYDKGKEDYSVASVWKLISDRKTESRRPLSVNLRLARIEDAIEEQATTLNRLESAIDRIVAGLG